MKGFLMKAAQLNEAQLIKTYTANAWVYNAWAWLTETRARDKALEFAAVKDGEHIVEVAVGTGLTLRELAKRNPQGQTQGFDITPAMLARAQKTVAGLEQEITLKLANARHLPLNNECVDLLVNNYMFDLLDEESFLPVFEEFKRVLKPDGRMVVTNMAMPKQLSHGFWEMIYGLNASLMGGCRGVDLHETVRQAGLICEAEHYVSQFGFPSQVLLLRRME